MPKWMIYGANGYTGDLAAREAVARGYRPILAGRNRDAVVALAKELDLEYRIFSLDDQSAADAELREMEVVLHCAGPFSHTYKPMADACLRTGTHYLDITGEIEVFEGLAARDSEAKEAKVMLMPGVGFDVVPSDCLAAHLKRRLPSATSLTLAFLLISRISRGTATTMAENIHRGGLIRKDAKLTPVPAGWKTRLVDFGKGPTKTSTIPWGDVSTAFYSTGIPNIEVYMASPLGLRIATRLARYFGGLMGSAWMQGLMKKRIQKGPAGPTVEERRRGKSFLWGEATDESGKRVASRISGPEGYTLTVLTALAVLERVFSGTAPAGFQTPSMAYGPDFVLTVPGMTREDAS